MLLHTAVIITVFICQSCTGTGKGGGLEKTPFARIINGFFAYKNGESDSVVYPGLCSKIHEGLQ